MRHCLVLKKKKQARGRKCISTLDQLWFGLWLVDKSVPSLYSNQCSLKCWLFSIFTDIHQLIPPSAVYMRQWIGSALVQIMACRLFGTKPLSKQCWVIVNWTLRNKLQWSFNPNIKLLIQENVPENIVCEMAAILSRFQCVKECALYITVCNVASILVWTRAHFVNDVLLVIQMRLHYSDVIMTTIVSQIADVSTVCADQRKYQSSASLAFVRGIHRLPVNSQHKGPVTRKMFPFDDVIVVQMFPQATSSIYRTKRVKLISLINFN